MGAGKGAWVKRPQGLVAVFVAANLALPIRGLWLRWFTDVEATGWAWQMFSTLP
jgi:hypothetical protein